MIFDWFNLPRHADVLDYFSRQVPRDVCIKRNVTWYFMPIIAKKYNDNKMSVIYAHYERVIMSAI